MSQHLNLQDPQALEYYSTPGAREIAHGIKSGNKKAIETAALQMASRVRHSDILIPVPGRGGRAKSTLSMAQAIARVSGATVADIIAGNKRESMYIAKANGRTLTAKELGFRLLGDIPEASGGHYLLVDNIIATGTTMQAALQLIPNAKPLAFAKDTKSFNR